MKLRITSPTIEIYRLVSRALSVKSVSVAACSPINGIHIVTSILNDKIRDEIVGFGAEIEEI